MREFHIGKNDENQRLDRFLGKAIPLLPASLAQKYIRLKRIKVNGARAQRDQKLVAGDILQCYINDEFFESPSEENVYLTITTPRLKIVYEDENIMLLDKPAGMLAHADEHEKVNTLVNHMLAYLYQKREWRPREENAFTPALCNRIDRNTGGIVIAAKNAEALRILNDKIRDREIAKYYLCIALGCVRRAASSAFCARTRRATPSAFTTAPCRTAAARSPYTKRSRRAASCRFWRSSCSRAVRIRSARAWPTSAIPCSATANTASAA